MRLVHTALSAALALGLVACATPPPSRPAPPGAPPGWRVSEAEGVSFEHPDWRARGGTNPLLSISGGGCFIALHDEGSALVPGADLFAEQVDAFVDVQRVQGPTRILARDVRADGGLIRCETEYPRFLGYVDARYLACGGSVYRLTYFCGDQVYDPGTSQRVLSSVRCSQAPAGARAASFTPPVAPPIQSRSFDLALTPTPPDAGSETDVTRFLARRTDVAMIHSGIPWDAYTPDNPQDPGKVYLDRLIEAARSQGQRLYLAADPLEQPRRRLSTPRSWGRTSFSDPRVREAFLRHTLWLASKRPTYLSLGVEMNLYHPENPSDFDAFLRLYDEARAVVRRVSPETLVFSSLQYEALLGLRPAGKGRMPRQGPPQFDLLRRIEDRSDLVALSTWPHLVYPTWSQVPPRYWEQMARQVRRPIAIVEGGWPSRPGRYGFDTSRSDQAAYLGSLARQANGIRSPLIALWTGFDLPEKGAGAIFGPLGLWDDDGVARPAGTLWEQLHALPRR
ncbi:MAG: hypothetical protein QNK05_09315 [Myxococcota bacterium]|nr:hypothetical protein [Myxococcota bacterium]